MATKTLHLVDNIGYSQATYCRRDVTPTMSVSDKAKEFLTSGRCCSQCCNAYDNLPRFQQRRARHAARMFKQGIRWFRLADGVQFNVVTVVPAEGIAFGFKYKRKTLLQVSLHDLWPETHK